ncbi:MAG: sulfatase activating formylglycine-generating enzyme [Celeribacter sp.]|jgi:formylglycine-generating enzyme required for sulfatase activity
MSSKSKINIGNDKMTPTRALTRKTAFISGCVIALAGVAFGAAYSLRGPDPQLIPALQTASVVMQNGDRLNVQIREITIAQWQDCFHAGLCTLDLTSSTMEIDYPATGLSYPDVMQYVNWINAHSDKTWRLPSASEWRELAADVMPETPDPIFTNPSLTWASTYLTKADQIGRALHPSGYFTATSDGIEDLDGNVWEWTQSCYAGSNNQGEDIAADRCPAFIMGGEHEAVMAYLIRDPSLGGCAVGAPPAHLGMRLVSSSTTSTRSISQ